MRFTSRTLAKSVRYKVSQTKDRTTAGVVSLGPTATLTAAITAANAVSATAQSSANGATPTSNHPLQHPSTPTLRYCTAWADPPSPRSSAIAIPPPSPSAPQQTPNLFEKEYGTGKLIGDCRIDRHGKLISKETNRE
nr:CBM_HP1_G0003780.mRNA.1.CDS.1 [Saccharomyces cerevisiae]